MLRAELKKGLEGELHIVIVDDATDDRSLIRRALTKAFARCVVADVPDALAWEAVVDDPEFHVIITDYQLRWSNGLTILKQSKERRPERPVIMFTATGTQEIAVEAMKAGLDDYLIKAPQHYVRVPVAIRRVLEQLAQKRLLEKSRREVLEKLAELELFQKSVGGRELKMAELVKENEWLKSENQDLRAKLRSKPGV
jgi:DNA-binding NtrC family response regulator